MRLNRKLRLHSKASLTALAAGVVGLIYLLLETAGIVPCITEGEVVALIAAVLNLLVLVGVLVEPTTQGVRDGEQAQRHDSTDCPLTEAAQR